jgi:hypothetical protein
MKAKARGAPLIHIDPRFTRPARWPSGTSPCGPAPTYRRALDRFGPADGELLAVALLEDQAGGKLRTAHSWQSIRPGSRPALAANGDATRRLPEHRARQHVPPIAPWSAFVAANLSVEVPGLVRSPRAGQH